MCKTNDGVNENPSLIQPSHLKYNESRRMPYVAMVDRLRSFLKQPSVVLCTIGYSFRDQHLNDAILECLQGNPTAVAFAFLFGQLDNYEPAIQLASSRSNLLLLAENEGIIGAVRAPWQAPDFRGENDEPSAIETHADDDGTACSLNLGDFAQFGRFLKEISGGHQVVI